MKAENYQIIAGACFALTLLAACDREASLPGPENEPEPPEVIGPDSLGIGEGENSIMRPDIESAPVIEPELEPLDTVISFAQGGSQLGEEARGKLAAIAESPQMEAGGSIILRGHTDSVGHDRDNLVVSRHRAEAVRDFLLGKGVDEGRIAIIAMGEMRPIAPNAKLDGTPDEKGRAQNRRVEIHIALPEESEDDTEAKAQSDSG